MDWRERIVCGPATPVGKSMIEGTRISVELGLGWLGSGRSVDQFLENQSHVQREDVLAAVTYASQYLPEERSIGLPQAA